MHPMQQLRNILLMEFPELEVKLDKPLFTGGVWCLDIAHVNIAYKQDKGYGIVYDPDHGYGEGAQEVFKDMESCLDRIIELIIEAKENNNG